jgi:hypothetical protein
MFIPIKWFSPRSVISVLLVMLIAGESALLSAGYRDNSDQMESTEKLSNATVFMSIAAVALAVGVFVCALVNHAKKRADGQDRKNKPGLKAQNDTLGRSRNDAVSPASESP